MQRRVLIADDNPAVRKTLRHLLEESGSYEVADAEDGQSALARAIEFHPDVIILDLAMPVMDGLSAAREISRVLPEAAILMYTMHWSSQLELEAKKCGVRMLVSKAQSTILLTAVQEILAAKDLESAPAATDSSLTSKTAAQSAPDPTSAQVPVLPAETPPEPSTEN